jgi:CheY-like chemotaxis protein
VTIQKVITITFASEDYELEIVGDGDAAIEKAREFLPDIILADVAMPGKTGYEVSKIIKNDPRLGHIPVLLLAGTFEPLDEAEAASSMSDGCIVKPFESQELIDKVAGLLKESAGAPGGDDAKEAGGGFEVPEEIWAEGDFAGISEEFDEKAGLSEEESTLPDLDFLESGGFLGEDMKEAPAEASAEAPLEASAEAQEASSLTPPVGGASELIDLDIVSDEPAKEPPALDIAPEEPSAKEAGPYVVEHFSEEVEPQFFGSEQEKPEQERGGVDAQIAELLEMNEEPVPFNEAESTGDEPGSTVEPMQESVARQFEEKAAPEPYEPFAAPEVVAPEVAAPEAVAPEVVAPEIAAEEFAAPDAVTAAVEEVADKAGDEVAARLPDTGGMPKEQIEEIVKKVAREVIEKIAWDVVPELAQELIEEEVKRFRKAWKRSE